MHNHDFSLIKHLLDTLFCFFLSNLSPAVGKTKTFKVLPEKQLIDTLQNIHSSLSSLRPQVVNPSFPNPRRRLRLRDLAERVIDARENEQELNKLLNEALLERETVQA